VARQGVIECPGPGWKANPGSRDRPKGTGGKKVDVVLAGGIMRSGWPASGGRPETRWTLIGSPFDIAWYRPAK
jgi:hypothetical protein